MVIRQINFEIDTLLANSVVWSGGLLIVDL